VRRADVIAVVQGGQVVEQGSADELLALEGGIYQRLVRAGELGNSEFWVQTGVSDSSGSSSDEGDAPEATDSQTHEAAAAAAAPATAST